jgi:ADP-heptose:LPS heptosyltransferase
MTNFLRKIVNYSILCALTVFSFFSSFGNRKSSGKKNSESVLIIKLEVLGDFIIFLPALKAYREFYKDKKLVLLVDHGQNAELSKNLVTLGIIDEYMFVDSKRFVKEFIYRFKVSLDLRRHNFETAIYTAYFRRNIGNFLTQVTRARERFAFVGYGIEFGGEKEEKQELSGIVPGIFSMFTKMFALKDYSINEYERNFRLAECIFGHSIERVQPYFPFIRDTQGNLEEKLLNTLKAFNLPKKYIVLGPGSGRDYRRWPEKRFAKVGAYAMSKGYSIVISGGPNEVELGNKLRDLILDESTKSTEFAKSAGPQQIVVVSGKTSPTELAAVMKDAAAVVSNDTGSIHIAASVQVPSICIMGCGGYPAFFPYADLSKNIAVVKLSPTCTRAWKCTETEDYIKTKKTLAPCVDNVTVEAVNKALDAFL